MRRALFIVLAVAACGSSAPAAPPVTPVPAPAPAPAPPAADASVPVALDQDLPRLAARATELYQAMAEAFGRAGTDCAAATARLTELQSAYADVIAANAKVIHEGRNAELRAALQPHAQALDTAARAVVESTTMATCAPDPAFIEAYDRLVGDAR